MTMYSHLTNNQQMKASKKFIKMFLTDDEGKEFTKKEIITTIVGMVVMFGIVLLASMFE